MAEEKKIHEAFDELRQKAKSVDDIIKVYENKINGLEELQRESEEKNKKAERRAKEAEEKAKEAEEKKQQVLDFKDSAYMEVVKDLFETPQKNLEKSIKKQSQVSSTVTVFFAVISIIVSIIISSKYYVKTADVYEVKKSSSIIEKEKNKDKIGDMVKISAGEFLYGDDKRKEIIKKAYEIDKYPVTNAQYKEFIDAGGYKKDRFWSEEGRKWRDKENIILPRYWNNKRFKGDDKPVVGVSFYEVKAYTKWLTHKRNDGYTYRLPTEKEWERAARGTDGRIYPWGDDFDKDKCNSRKSGHGKTTPVTLYPNGVSPEGCYDMAGNVWEWTAEIVLRGGSWIFDDVSDFRSACRIFSYPGDWGRDAGFRCART